ncbi:MAG: MOSC domain-containing protein [Pseudomonadota bacterium]
MAQQEKLGTVGGLFRYPVKSLGGEALEAADVFTSGIVGDRLWAFRDVERNQISTAKRNPLLLQIAARLRDDGHADLTFPSGEVVRTDATECSALVSNFTGRPHALFGLRPATDTAHFARAPISPEMFEAYVREVAGLEAEETLPDYSKFPAEVLMNATVPGTYFDAASIHIVLASELGRLQETLTGADANVARFRPNIVLNDLDAPLMSDDLVGATVRVGAVVMRIDYLTPRCAMTTHAQGNLPKAPQIMRALVRDWKHNFGLYASVLQGGQIAMGDPVQRLD